MSQREQVIRFTVEDDDGLEHEHELPAKWEICGGCRGNGKHVNPAIDGNGLTREDFDADPDFEEAYFSGQYDVRCEVCHGTGKVLVVDEYRANPARLAEYIEQQQTRARWAAEERYERRMGY